LPRVRLSVIQLGDAGGEVAGHVTSIATYRASRELYLHLILRELRSKYKRSFLGWAWSTVTPLTTMLVYTIVFRLFLKIHAAAGSPSGLHFYAVYLLCALLPWAFFQNSVLGGIGSLLASANLIKKTYFPRDLLPAATVASNLVSHSIEMGILYVVLMILGNFHALEFIPLVVVLVLLVALFALGLGLMLSVLNVYFRDIEYFMSILFLVWMYLTPIIYPFSYVPARYQLYLKLNPMTDAVLSFRAMLYDGAAPGAFEFIGFGVTAIAVFGIGWLVFNKLEGRLAEEL
jgi:lipopolysaccharide transport system permease protein